MGEVIDHILHFIPVIALGEPQHSEVGVPVIDLAETPARHHVRLRQRQQGIPFAGGIGRARQHRPQAVDMLAQALSGWRNIGFAFLRQGKVQLNEMAQVKARLVTLHAVIGQDHQRIAVRHRVGERFLIGEQFGALYIRKQRAEKLVR